MVNAMGPFWDGNEVWLITAGGVFFVAAFLYHGALWLAAKSTATLFGVAGMFPNIVGSSLDPAASVTAFNSASSPLTLKIMLGVVLTFLPVVIAYQTWVLVRFGGPVTKESVEEGPSY